MNCLNLYVAIIYLQGHICMSELRIIIINDLGIIYIWFVISCEYYD